MKEKFKVLTKSEEQERAYQSLIRGICFINQVPLNDKPYDLVYHAGADSFVFVSEEYMKTDKETTDVQILTGQSSP